MNRKNLSRIAASLLLLGSVTAGAQAATGVASQKQATETPFKKPPMAINNAQLICFADQDILGPFPTIYEAEATGNNCVTFHGGQSFQVQYYQSDPNGGDLGAGWYCYVIYPRTFRRFLRPGATGA